MITDLNIFFNIYSPAWNLPETELEKKMIGCKKLL